MDYKTILLVDDEPDILGQYSLFFSKSGFRVLMAENGTQALKEFDEYEPAVVIVDYQMPGMNGLELLEQIKRRNNMVQVILVSGQADMKVAVQALKEQAFDFIPKPPDLIELLDKVKQAIDRTKTEVHDREMWTGAVLTHERFDSPKPVSVIHFKVKLDEFNTGRIMQEYNKFVEDAKLLPKIILALDGVDYINNVGLNMLVNLHKQMVEEGRKVILTGLRTRVSSYLKSLGYYDFFEITGTLDRAKALI